MTIQELPQPPEGSLFSLDEIRKIHMPHPYCISEKHVAFASDHYMGMLGKEAIEAGEKEGIICGICRNRKLNYTFGEHKEETVLFLRVEQDKGGDLNQVEGLNAYLNTIKETLESNKIGGIAFKQRGQK